jgi:hypothetical protein
MRTKVQGRSSIAKVERAHQVLMPHTNKYTTLTPMDADHQKIGRKILDLRGQKATTECMIPGEIITRPGAATQDEVAAGAEVKTSLSIACSMKEILTIRQGTVQSS